MKVKVDYDACEANAVCMGIVPEVFRVDDDDNLWVEMDEIPPELQDRVRQAVASCPKVALALEE